MPATPRPNRATDMAMNAKWYARVTEKIRVRLSSETRMQKLVRKIPQTRFRSVLARDMIGSLSDMVVVGGKIWALSGVGPMPVNRVLGTGARIPAPSSGASQGPPGRV